MTDKSVNRLLQRLAFSETRHFSRDMFPANTMAYDTDAASAACGLSSQVDPRKVSKTLTADRRHGSGGGGSGGSGGGGIVPGGGVGRC